LGTGRNEQLGGGWCCLRKVEKCRFGVCGAVGGEPKSRKKNGKLGEGGKEGPDRRIPPPGGELRGDHLRQRVAGGD